MFSDNLIDLCKNDPDIAVLTGAGMSAESGVPTFRGEDGIWNKFYLITQNVDGLHRVAGNSDPIELHGNIMRNRCLDCNGLFTEVDLPLKEKEIPRCSKCGGILRPDVVWFGEELPRQALIDSDEAISKVSVFLSIGTSAQVQPAASMPLWAKNNGAYIVEINIEETLLTPFVDEFIQGESGKILPDLVRAIVN